MKRVLCLILSLSLLCLSFAVGASAESVVKLPAGVKTIEAQQFYGDKSLSKVVLPDGLREIRDKAFADSGVREINLPETLTYIAPDTFDHCSNVNVKVAPNSYALVWAQNHTDDVTYTVSEEVATRFGDLAGDVRSAGNREAPIVQALVSLMSGGGTMVQVQTDGSGHYYIPDIIEGEYDIRVEARGFVLFTGRVSIHAGETTYSETFLMVDGDASRTGVASGRVTDAFTGHPLAGLNLEFRSGWNTRTGDVAGRTTTNSDGAYSIELPIGNYTMTAAPQGYAASSLNIVVLADGAADEQNLSVAPAADANEYRIKLTWGENPSDLDSHMTGTTPAGGSFHVYYRNKNAYDGESLLCNLDVDDTSSYGPEVITLHASDATPYYYYIHHYAGSGSIGTSGARIEVYKGGTLVRTFNAPTTLGDGRYWNVFSISDGRIIGRNTITSAPGDGSGLDEDPDADKSALTWPDGSTVREEIDIPSDARQENYSFITDRAWRVSAPEWITLDKTSGVGTKDGKPIPLTATISENKDMPREGDIVISATNALPLVVHVIQAGSGAGLAMRIELDAMNGDGDVPGKLYVLAHDGDDSTTLTVENVDLSFALSKFLRSAELNGRVKIRELVEDVPYVLDFKLYYSPTEKQLEQLGKGEDVQPERVTVKVDANSEQCGSYRYTLALDAYPGTIETVSFNQYLADQLLRYSSLSTDIDTVVFYSAPYRAMVEPLKNSAKFQAALLAWMTATYNLSNVTDHAEKEVDYYRAYVYTMICPGDNGLQGDTSFGDSIVEANGLLKSVKKYIKSFSTSAEALSNMGLLDGFGKNFTTSDFMKVMSDYSSFIVSHKSDGTLPPELKQHIREAEAFNALNKVPDYLDAATTVGDVLARIVDLSKLNALTDEKAAMLNEMAAKSDSAAFKLAVAETVDLLPNVTPALAYAIIIGEETAKAAINKANRALYSKVVAAAPQFALVRDGTKTLINVIANTDGITAGYYECEAGINMEDLLVERVRKARSAFQANPSEANAEALISVVEAYYANKVQALKAADGYARAVLEGNEILNFARDTEVSEAELTEALAKACKNADGGNNDLDFTNAVQYAVVHRIIEDSKKRCGSFMSSGRASAIAGYYAASHLTIASESTEQLK